MSPGTVYLVGAGPGDPGLITRRGAGLLAQADCVIYDRLAAAELLRLTKKGCRRIYAGKGSDEEGKSQSAINRILVEAGRRHRRVVRLKGGDPTLFGRISEELEALSQAGIPCEVVPGVSSAWAAAAAAGIPLTDRRFSSSVAVVTGQGAAGKKSAARWEALAKAVDTIVILMGRKNLPEIARRLMKGGRPAATPAALIRWATTAKQETLVTTLGGAARDLGKRPDFGPPVVAVIGEVVRQARRIGAKPLQGKRVLVTRPLVDQREFISRLHDLGAECVALPTVVVRARKFSRAERERLLRELPGYDWIIFTSHHGVEALTRLAKLSGKAKLCAIGPRTARSAREAGLRVDLIPDDFSTAGLRRVFGRMNLAGKRILIPRSNLGVRDELARGLRKQGARLDEVVMYETRAASPPPGKTRQALTRIDCLTFTSASTVSGFVQALRKARVPLRRGLNGTAVAAIGPATGKALKEAGIGRFHLPKGSWTIEGLTGAVVEALA
ncbi:MAG: uroporphyrinogen-III C-methyltransferase [Candidatus Omnitrophica bacterium]|nr:uroporphyrinogen-III C-methyltransferase [Candidatus Omnitrophota bacterium]